jgi:hypothetical protein
MELRIDLLRRGESRIKSRLKKARLRKALDKGREGKARIRTEKLKSPNLEMGGFVQKKGHNGYDCRNFGANGLRRRLT